MAGQGTTAATAPVDTARRAHAGNGKARALIGPGLRTFLIFAVLVALGALIFPSSYFYRVGTLVWINTLAVTGIVVLLGYVGLVSLGHAGFFAIGAYATAIYAAVAGALLALANGYITPETGGFMHSVEMVTMAVLGGASSVFGALVGALILTALPQVLTVFADYEHMVLGGIMVLTMIAMRRGLVPFIVDLWNRRKS